MKKEFSFLIFFLVSVAGVWAQSDIQKKSFQYEVFGHVGAHLGTDDDGGDMYADPCFGGGFGIFLTNKWELTADFSYIRLPETSFTYIYHGITCVNQWDPKGFLMEGSIRYHFFENNAATRPYFTFGLGMMHKRTHHDVTYPSSLLGPPPPDVHETITDNIMIMGIGGGIKIKLRPTLFLQMEYKFGCGISSGIDVVHRVWGGLGFSF